MPRRGIAGSDSPRPLPGRRWAPRRPATRPGSAGSPARLAGGATGLAQCGGHTQVPPDPVCARTTRRRRAARDYPVEASIAGKVTDPLPPAARVAGLGALRVTPHVGHVTRGVAGPIGRLVAGSPPLTGPDRSAPGHPRRPVPGSGRAPPDDRRAARDPRDHARRSHPPPRPRVAGRRREEVLSVLSIDSLHVTYGGAVQAVRGVSMEVPDGKVVAVLGSNGAGQEHAAAHHLRNAETAPGQGRLRFGAARRHRPGRP